jgi:hypothetical protein
MGSLKAFAVLPTTKWVVIFWDHIGAGGSMHGK